MFSFKSGVNTIQDSISQVADWWSEVNKFQLNAYKCKELQINLTKTPRIEDHITIDNDQSFQVVQSAKILGVTISGNLKWNAHIENVTTKASRRPYQIKLKHADVDIVSLVQFYCSCIRSILEYACQVFHHNIPRYLSDNIEHIQKACLTYNSTRSQIPRSLD